jgi:hypothetical protein
MERNGVLIPAIQTYIDVKLAEGMALCFMKRIKVPVTLETVILSYYLSQLDTCTVAVLYEDAGSSLGLGDRRGREMATSHDVAMVTMIG